VNGVERPKTESGEGKTPALGDHQARKLLDAPDRDSIKSKLDRAILSTLLFHALRREELCKLKVKDFRHARKGVPHLKVSGKGGKTRYLPLHPGTNGLITDYLAADGHDTDENGALFRPVKSTTGGRLDIAITADGVYRLVRTYSAQNRALCSAMNSGSHARSAPIRPDTRGADVAGAARAGGADDRSIGRPRSSNRVRSRARASSRDAPQASPQPRSDRSRRSARV
jgi:hypothetical protein